MRGQKILAILLVGAALLAGALPGCRTVKKSSSSQVSRSDSSAKKTIDSIATSKSATQSEKGSSEVSKKTAEKTESQSIKVGFKVGDSSAKIVKIQAADYFAPGVLKKDKTGASVTLELPSSATGLEISGSRSWIDVDSFARLEYENEIQLLQDSVRKLSQDTSSRTAQSIASQEAVEKKANWIGGLWSLGIAAGALLIFLFIIRRRKREN